MISNSLHKSLQIMNQRKISKPTRGQHRSPEERFLELFYFVAYTIVLYFGSVSGGSIGLGLMFSFAKSDIFCGSVHINLTNCSIVFKRRFKTFYLMFLC